MVILEEEQILLSRILHLYFTNPHLDMTEDDRITIKKALRIIWAYACDSADLLTDEEKTWIREFLSE